MSRHYQSSADVPTNILIARLKELSDAITKGRSSFDGEFTTRIRAEVDRDADLVLGEAARRLEELDAEIPSTPKQVRNRRWHIKTDNPTMAGWYITWDGVGSTPRYYGDDTESWWMYSDHHDNRTLVPNNSFTHWRMMPVYEIDA